MGAIFHNQFGKPKAAIVLLTGQADISNVPSGNIGLWLGGNVNLRKSREIAAAFERCANALREYGVQAGLSGYTWASSAVNDTKDQASILSGDGAILAPTQATVAVLYHDDYPKSGGSSGATQMFDGQIEMLIRAYQEFAYTNLSGTVA